MTEGKTPCSSNPDQWYTERDGRRYDDEPLLTEEQVELIAGPLREVETALEEIEDEIDAATAEVVRQRLIERRQARDACFGCPARLQCLDLALQRREQYGIWGGYFPEQRRSIERALDARLERVLAGGGEE